MKNNYKLNTKLIVIIALFLCNVFYGQAQQYFSLKGSFSDSAGIFLYNKIYDENGHFTYDYGPALPNPYNISDSAVAKYINGYKYVDYETRKTFTVEAINQFTAFNNALTSNSLNASDIFLCFYYGELNSDPQNWSIINNIENRKYYVQLQIYVNSTKIANVYFNDLKAKINYNNPYNATDDKITFESEYGFVEKEYDLSNPYSEIADSMMKDINSKGIKLLVNQMQFDRVINIVESNEILKGKLYNVTDAKLIVGNECPINAEFTAKVDFYTPKYGKNWEFVNNNVNSNYYNVYIDYGDGSKDTLIEQSSGIYKTHEYASFGTRNVTMTVVDINDPSCSNTFTKTINVVKKCNNCNVSMFSSSCNSYMIDVSPDGFQGTTAYKVNWNLGDSIYNDTTVHASMANFFMYYDTPGSKNIVISIFDQVETSCEYIYTDSIYIYPRVVIDNIVKINPGDSSRFLFDVNTSGGSGNFTYKWNNLEGNYFEVYNDTFNYAFKTGTGDFYYNLSIDDRLTNCSDMKADTVHVAYQDMNKTLAYLGVDPTSDQCDKIINFKFYAQDGLLTTCYVEFDWDNDGIADSVISNYDTQSPIFNIDHEYAVGNYTARIKVVSINMPTQFSEYTTNFTVNDALSTNYEVIQNKPNEVTLKAIVSGGSGSYDYNWNIEGAIYKTADVKLNLTEYREYHADLTIKDKNKPLCIDYIYPIFELKNFNNNSCMAMYSYTQDTLNERKLYFENYSSSYLQSNPDSIQYFWDFNDGTYSSEMNPVHTFATNGNYKVKLSINDGFGCINLYETNIMIGDISTYCYAAFDYSVNMATNTVTFENLSTSYPNGCVWYFGDGSVSTQANPTYTYATSGVYYVGLMIYNQAQQCMDYTEQMIEVGIIDNYCNANFIFYNDIATNKVYFTNTSTGTANNYYWDFGDGDTSSLANPIHQYTTPGYYDVCLNIWNTSTNCWNMQCKPIIAGEDSTICLADFSYMSNFNTKTVNFTNKTMGDYTESNWDFGDGTTSTTANPFHTYAEPGMYLVSLSVKNNFDFYSYYYDIVTLDTTHEGIYGDFGYVAGQGPGKAAGKVDYKGTTFGDVSKVIWNFGDDNLDSTRINVTHEYENPGNYNVCLKVVNQQGETYNKCKTVNIALKVAENSKLDFNIYPNPAKEELFVNYNLANEGNIDITIYDALGSQVLSKENISVKGVFKSKINVSSLNQGVYFVKIKTDKGVGVQKFIINK